MSRPSNWKASDDERLPSNSYFNDGPYSVNYPESMMREGYAEMLRNQPARGGTSGGGDNMKVSPWASGRNGEV